MHRDVAAAIRANQRWFQQAALAAPSRADARRTVEAVLVLAAERRGGLLGTVAAALQGQRSPQVPAAQQAAIVRAASTGSMPCAEGQRLGARDADALGLRADELQSRLVDVEAEMQQAGGFLPLWHCMPYDARERGWRVPWGPEDLALAEYCALRQELS